MTESLDSADKVAVADEIGRIADIADNFREYGLDGFAKLPPIMRIDAMYRGLTEIRDKLRQLAIILGLDADTWAFEPEELANV